MSDWQKNVQLDPTKFDNELFAKAGLGKDQSEEIIRIPKFLRRLE